MLDFLNISEKLKGNLEYSALADNANFGLEFYLRDETDARIRKLLDDGIKFCKLLETGNELYDQSTISIQDLEPRSAFASLLTSMLDTDEESPELQHKKETVRKTLGDQLTYIKRILEAILNGEEKITTKEIRKCQKYFNEISTPYLRQAFFDMRKLEREELIQ